MDPRLATFLGLGLELDSPILEAIDASYNALTPVDYFRSRLKYKYNIDLDQWGEFGESWDQLEPDTSIVFPLSSNRKKSIQILKTFTGLVAFASTSFERVRIQIEFDTPRVQITEFFRDADALLSQ